MEGAPRRSPRADSLLLQLRQTSQGAEQGAEIRTRGPDTGHAGGIDHQAADVQGDLLLDDEFFGAAKHHTCVLRLDHVGQCGRFAHFYGGVATLDGGSTLDSILATDTKTDTAGNQDSGAAPQAIDNIANRHAVEPGAY